MAYFTNSLGYSYQHISSYCFCRRPFVHLFLFCLWFSRVYSGIAWSILINAGVWVGNDGGMMCVKFLVDWARLSYGYWHFFRVKLEFLLQFRERRQRMVCYNNSLPLHI